MASLMRSPFPTNMSMVREIIFFYAISHNALYITYPQNAMPFASVDASETIFTVLSLTR